MPLEAAGTERQSQGKTKWHALLMVTLILVAIPIAFLNEVNSIAALTLVRGADFLSVFDKSQRDALARLFLNLRGGGFDVAGIFWGLWLFPLGMLVYRSGFIPRFLRVLLMLGTFAYLANSFTSLVPQYEPDVSRWMDPLQAVEVVFMLWLLIVGAKPNHCRVRRLRRSLPRRVPMHSTTPESR